MLTAMFAYDFGPNVHVGFTSTDQKFPDIDIDDDGNIHIVWVNYSGNYKNIYYSRSLDNGITFSEPIQINSVSNHVVAFVGAGPRIRCFDGKVYVVWADSRNGYNNTSIYLNKSNDNGLNWINEVGISDQPHFQLYGDIEIDPNGMLHLVYYNYGSSLHFVDIRYAKMQLAGMMLYESIPLGVTTSDAEPCDCCSPDLMVADNGDVYIAYRNNISNIRDHYIVKKPHDSDSFSDAVLIAEMNHYITYCPSSSPAIDIENNTIVSGFMSGSSTSTYFTYGNSENLEFVIPIDVNSTSSSSSIQNYPTVAIENEIGHIAWVDYSWEGGDIFYANSLTNSLMLSDEQIINDDGGNSIQTTPIIKCKNDIIYSVWSDDRGADYQIYFSSTNQLDITQGDINQDGIINILDIVSLVNFILQNDTPNIIEQTAADMDGNGILNILDIVQIINIILPD